MYNNAAFLDQLKKLEFIPRKKREGKVTSEIQQQKNILAVLFFQTRQGVCSLISLFTTAELFEASRCSQVYSFMFLFYNLIIRKKKLYKI